MRTSVGVAPGWSTARGGATTDGALAGGDTSPCGTAIVGLTPAPNVVDPGTSEEDANTAGDGTLPSVTAGTRYSSFAMRWISMAIETGSASGTVGAPGCFSGAGDTPGVGPLLGTSSAWAGRGAWPTAGRSSPGTGRSRSGVLMEVIDRHALEDPERVVREHRHRAVQREQV